MASVNVNGSGPSSSPLIPRGRPFNIGTLTAAASVVQFTLDQEESSPNGVDCLTLITVGGTITPGLECSIDGGNTWFGLVVRTPTFTVTTLNSDTAASSAGSYDVSGLQAGGLFRFGSTAITGSPVVWALFS